MRWLLVACVGLILVGAADPGGTPRDPEVQAKLDKWLDGRVAGETRTCLPTPKTNTPIGIDDHTMLFRDGPRIWRNELRRGTECGKVGKPYALVSSAAMTAGRICSGAVVGVVDMHDPTVAVGACELGDFTLYQKP
jgi:hypothetical protein